jgi:hypothetical protein
MKRTLLLVVAAAMTIAAGCGSSDGQKPASGTSASAAPTPAQLLTRALQATKGKSSAGFTLEVTASAKSSDPQITQFLGKPLHVKLTGAAAKNAVDLTGSARVAGKDYPFAVRADQQRTFVQLLGTWYGPSSGLSSTSSATNPADAAKTLRVVRRYANQVLTGSVTEGPEVDGVDTWKFSGTPNADGIIRVAEQEGEHLSSDDKAALRALAPLVKLTIVTGRDDGLPRSVGVRFDLNSTQMALLKRLGADTGSTDLQELHLNLTVDLSDWGKQVSISAPSNPQPFEQITGALLGVALSSGALNGP